MSKETIPCRVLSGARIRLRPFDAGKDAAALFSVCSRGRAVKFYGMKPMRSVSEAEELLSDYARGANAGTSAHWAIIDIRTDKVIGDTGIMSVNDRDHRAGSYCILHLDYWGKGLANDAMKMLFDHVFSTTKINRLQALIDVRNERAIKNVQCLGFVQEGVLRDYEYDHDEFIDEAVFSVTRHDWCKVRHAVFGSQMRSARKGLSWQVYEIDDETVLWIYDETKRLYHLLSGCDADAWLKAADPMPLLENNGFTSEDSRTADFMTRIYEAGVVYEVHWDITGACNSRCRHCYYHGVQKKMRACHDDSEMSDDECREVLRALRASGVFRLIFSGGEPLVRPGMLKLLRYARELGFQVVLYTNGILINEECADRIADLDLVSVDISNYGACAETHDAVSGISGSFDKSLRALSLLTKRGVHTVMKCVGLHSNSGEVSAMEKLGHEVAENTFVNYVFYPAVDGNCSINDEMMRISEITAEALDPGSVIFFKRQSRQLCRYETGREYVCTRCLRSLYLNSRGEVFPCIAIPRIMGNWRSIFNGSSAPVENDAEFTYWQNLKFSDVPQCGKRCYCPFCYSICPGDGLLINGDEHLPPKNHCRLAIGRFIASRWTAERKSPDEWRRFSSEEKALRAYLDSFGISEAEYAVGGII